MTEYKIQSMDDLEAEMRAVARGEKPAPADAARPSFESVEAVIAMTNPRDYPDTIQSAESGRPLRRGVKMLTIDADGHPFTYGQPGWWVSIDDPTDKEGQLTDEDNLIRAAARREARANAMISGKR